MPRTIDYTHKSYQQSYELAEAIDKCGGTCSVEIAAEKMSLKVTGSFRALIASAAKFGFITIKSGTLSVTDTYKNIKLSYDDREKQKLSIEAFFTPPLYRKLYEKFKGQAIPVDIFDKMLAKDYDVASSSDAVASIFIKGGEQLGFIKDNQVAAEIEGGLAPMIEKEKTTSSKQKDAKPEGKKEVKPKSESAGTPSSKPVFSNPNNEEIKISIKGKGLNYDIPVADKADWIILNAILKKVKLKIEKEKGAAESNS